MILYQPTIEVYKFSLWKGKWVQHKLYSSTLVFRSWFEAEGYKYKYISGLQKEVKLKAGTFKFHIAELILNDNL